MLSIMIDARGAYRVTVPHDAPGLIKLARTYMSCELALPEDQRVREPRLSVIESLVVQMEGGSQGRQTGEVSRAQSADLLAQARAQAVPLARTALKALEVRYASNLAAIEAWGFSTVATSSGVKVRRPPNTTRWCDALRAYYEKERSLPAEQRIATPAFADVEQVVQAVSSHTSQRDDGRYTRRKGVSERDAPAILLQDLLQIACAVLVSRADAKVTLDLERWGFKTAAVKTNGAAPTEPVAVDAPPG